jgi:predicted O-linked N-acetylglucosamine transferase (SPINDLY family)
LNIQQSIDQARQFHAAGRFAEAERLYRQVVAKQPDNLDAVMLLALTLALMGRHADAESHILRAQSKAPTSAMVLGNLAIIRANQGRWSEAVEAIDAAIASDPGSRQLWSTKGNLLQAAGRLPEAVEAYRRALDIEPHFAPGWNELGAAQFMAGRGDEAIASFQRAAELNPNDAGSHFNLSQALSATGETERALQAVDRALALQPSYAQAWNQRGVILMSVGRTDDAVEAFTRAVQFQPGLAIAFNNLGVAEQKRFHFDKAIAAHRRAIEFQSNYGDAYGNLAQALSMSGEGDAALETYRVARQKAADRRCMSSMMFFLHTHPDFDAKAIAREHRDWEDTFARPLYSQISPHTNDRNPDRRLRVAYLSADLNENPAGRFMLPLLENHDHNEVEIVCYYNLALSDAMTDRLRAHADEWHESWRFSDAELAQKVRNDRIDVLVDLMMHSKGSRLLALARKPAPVQMVYLAYCSSTGVSAIDYRISDPYLDPPGTDESVYVEKTARVSGSYWVYPVPVAAPEVSPVPSESAGFVTFGCMNNFWKVSRVAIGMWKELLRRMPDSRLLVHCHEGPQRQRFIERLAIEPSRVDFVAFQPATDYFRTFSRVDISLDPFPFGGGTTTCDSLWMGVPVVSRRGDTAVSRGGASILSNVGLGELVVDNAGDYVKAAIALASDRDRLRELRTTLRDRMRHSPLMDGRRLARDLEVIYRTAWRNWCDKGA